MVNVTFLGDILGGIAERGRALLESRGEWSASRVGAGSSASTLTTLADRLLSRSGEASGVALAQILLLGYAAASADDRLAFLRDLAERFGPDRDRVEEAVEAFRSDPSGLAGSAALSRLHAAAEPRRQELFRRLNLAPGGTASLVRMREDLLGHLGDEPSLGTVDGDFAHLFSSWFNRGFLVLRPIDWTTPANILEKIIRYEAVHAIQDWDDLRNRLEPSDRRCYGFFHPQLVDEPLIFVEVALTKDTPAAIAPLLDRARVPIPAGEANTAVFYSISNTQRGLGGVSFGNFLIKQVVENLRRELPNLRTFVTLSPAPGFAAWLAKERTTSNSACLDASAMDALLVLDEPGWHGREGEAPATAPGITRARSAIMAAAAHYFLKAKNAAGRPLDPVARFHLGNGARLERINFLGDLSPKALRQSHGLMVNYLYALDEIEANHEAFAEKRLVAASSPVRRMLRADLPAVRDLAPVV